MDPHKKSKIIQFRNPIESLREGSSEAIKTTNNEVFRPMAQEFMDQMLGKRKFKGEILPGESLEMKSVFSGKQEKEETSKRQLALERTLLEEERKLIEKRSSELSLQIEAIQVEVTKLTKVTPGLAREVQIASFQARGSVSTYELFFLKHLFDFIKSFREHIEQAHVWLSVCNARARKKNVWGAKAKEHGAKYIFSGEHYSGRSAA